MVRVLPGWLRGVAALTLLAIGLVAIAHSIGIALAARNPDEALRFAPWNSVALTQSAVRTLERNQGPDARGRALTLAQRAVLRDATSADALGVMGLAKVHVPSARNAFAMSQRLSRRALRTQLWLIEDAVGRDDVSAALYHYDVALRTSRSAPSLLFPILVEAVNDPALIAPLAAALAKRPLWGGLYLQQMAQSGTSLDGIARLFETLMRRGIDPGVSATATLYDRLVAASAWEQAWGLYAASHPSANRGGVRQLAAINPDTGTTPFEWQTSDNAALLSRIEPSANGSMLMFSSATGEGGDAARQLLLLAPGLHKMAIDYGPVQIPDNASPFLKLSCATGMEIARLTLSGTAVSSRKESMAVTVPATCPAQWISLVLQPASSGELIEGSVRHIAID